jgi:aryl-alcohol dehydrogenase
MASFRHGVEEPAEIIYESVGPIFSVQPWDVPFWQVLRFFITTALVGNTALIKHAESVDIFIPQLIELNAQGHFPFENLTKFYSLDQINQAAQDSEREDTIKPIIRLSPV